MQAPRLCALPSKMYGLPMSRSWSARRKLCHFQTDTLISSSRWVCFTISRTQAAIQSLACKLAAGGTMLVYLYYAFDNRPTWFRSVGKISDLLRRVISRLPFSLRYVLSQVIAL